MSPYYYLAKRCIQKGKHYLENNKCVDQCTPHLEYYYGYPEVKIEIPVEPGQVVYVCDCSFRCCTKWINDLYKSLDRGFIDGSYHYFRQQQKENALVSMDHIMKSIKTILIY